MREFGHVPRDRFDDEASILCALGTDNQFVAALRVVLPERRPFDFEDNVDLEQVLGQDCRPALIGRFCVHPDYRIASKSLTLQAHLMRMTYWFARQKNVSDIIMYSYANLVMYYRGLFFRHLEVNFVHPSWGTVVLMGLNIPSFTGRYRRSQNTIANFILDDRLGDIEF
jgi:hypothetical protein